MTLRGAAIAALVATASAAGAQEVRIDTGRLRGVGADGVESFRGIPYAAPPVGALRWRPPQKPAKWRGIRAADAFGPDCQQALGTGDSRRLAEDCLTLNVWRPAGRRIGALPVIVWVHGGGYVAGGSSDPQTWGDSFARRGVILVTFNYRLGRLGFFAHPALSREHPHEPKGNYGLLDQIAALKWVKRNIARFGGDPMRVTAMGESAGGESVLILAGSPAAAGLFQRAIVQSGGGRAPLLGRRLLREAFDGRTSAESAGLAFARSAGIDGEDVRALAQLRALPERAVNEGLTMVSLLFGGLDRFTGPIEDGRVVKAPPSQALAAGKKAVPMVIGSTSADLGLNLARSKGEAFAAFGKSADAARAAYDPDGTLSLAALNQAIGADRTMAEPARHIANVLTARNVRAWRFRFSYVAEALRGKPIAGAEHASDVAYAFARIGAALNGRQTRGDAAVADLMNGYWANFASTGNPNGVGLPPWPEAPSLMIFTANGEAVAGADPWRERLDAAEARAGSAN